jgi:hypothetical protein
MPDAIEQSSDGECAVAAPKPGLAAVLEWNRVCDRSLSKGLRGDIWRPVGQIDFGSYVTEIARVTSPAMQRALHFSHKCRARVIVQWRPRKDSRTIICLVPRVIASDQVDRALGDLVPQRGTRDRST